MKKYLYLLLIAIAVPAMAQQKKPPQPQEEADQSPEEAPPEDGVVEAGAPGTYKVNQLQAPHGDADGHGADGNGNAAPSAAANSPQKPATPPSLDETFDPSVRHWYLGGGVGSSGRARFEVYPHVGYQAQGGTKFEIKAPFGAIGPDVFRAALDFWHIKTNGYYAEKPTAAAVFNGKVEVGTSGKGLGTMMVSGEAIIPILTLCGVGIGPGVGALYGTSLATNKDGSSKSVLVFGPGGSGAIWCDLDRLRVNLAGYAMANSLKAVKGAPDAHDTLIAGAGNASVMVAITDHLEAGAQGSMVLADVNGKVVGPVEGSFVVNGTFGGETSKERQKRLDMEERERQRKVEEEKAEKRQKEEKARREAQGSDTR